MSRFRHSLILFFILSAVALQDCAMANDKTMQNLISELSQFGSRQTGTKGYEKSADFIVAQLQELGLDPQIHLFPVPVRQTHRAEMFLDGNSVTLHPLYYNAITPQSIDDTISAPLYYAGDGSMAAIEGIPIADSILLLEFDSGINWQQVASLGAKAVIFLDRGDLKNKQFFQEKEEVSPIQFPMFWMKEEEASALFGELKNHPRRIEEEIQLKSSIQWQEVMAKNIYCLIPGSDPELQKKLLTLEAFYDNSTFIPGRAPGADEAASIATLLKTAASLKQRPPGRSVLLLATSGHAQTLAGLREIIWSMRSRSKELRGYKKRVKNDRNEAEKNLETLTTLHFPLTPDTERDNHLASAIQNRLKSSVDLLSRELVSLRLKQKDNDKKEQIESLVTKRFAMRQLGWKEDFSNLTVQENQLLKELLPAAILEQQRNIKNLEKHQQAFRSTLQFRDVVSEFDVEAFISLHLSSHGTGIGGFHKGWLYQLRSTINRTGIYSEIGDVLSKAALQSNSEVPYIDSLRPSRMRTWDSWFIDNPFLGGEVSSLAGYLGLTLATVGDSRSLWGTPWDTPTEVNWDWLVEQEKLITTMTHSLSWADKLQTGKLPRNGFSSVTGRTNLLLQGELFANYPAHKTTILAYQGKGKFYAYVDTGGFFNIRGVADKKHVVDKVILEAYRFDETSGRVLWAIDKKETGKANYRVKMQRNEMKTNLTMFSCRETTIFDLLEPRNFKYLTKLEILDGRRDAPPQHYFYSRLDTRTSIISSIYTEPGTWLKLTLSDTVLSRKLLLSNSTEDTSFGYGYPVDNYPSIPNTPYYAAKDAWSLLRPRIENLENHGIIDPQVKSLQKKGLAALAKSAAALETMKYGELKESSFEALALASRVYMQVEKTQKDVLFGVLFYIALFVPFAFCMERFLFNYANIYKRIVSFSLLLVGLIFIIYNVHPAFQLAYSPMVVILAFFIIGLSLMVTLILFFRFEEEMILLQRHASHKRPSEISHWKAFVAAFFLGVSNLRRRRLRTILTCLTLIILTFTIMSFTTVKSSQKHNKLLFQEKAPYNGLLLKTMNWQNLPREAASILTGGLPKGSITTPRVWLEGRNVTMPVQVPLTNGEKTIELQGLIGLSSNEPEITGLDSILTSGRWFNVKDRHSLILEKESAQRLGILPHLQKKFISLWGIDFEVIGIFDGSRLDAIADLDGEPLTPVTFPQEMSAELSDVEQEAMESGDDVRSLQSRYRHVLANQTVIIPARTLFAMGGKLKNVAIKPAQGNDIDTLGSQLVDRFSLPIFAGEQSGVWFFSPSSTLSYSGVPNILVPLIISIFIVLNTMISSVYERKNEIAVYTSVGLAPSHVSFLFIAEALALAVISVVLGYLLAQVSAALFSSTSYWAGITVNYSSLAGVAAMILVIVVVLISVIYPSRVAAKIAIPDVNRSFKLPEAIDNTITVILPFFLKHEEQESIGGFIHSYLTGHQDISHGLFSTGPVDIVSSSRLPEKSEPVQSGDPTSPAPMHLRAKVWLAPFDFGIMQEVDIQFCPVSDSNDYLEIKIVLERYSGEIGMWQRVNTLFLHDIRKQLLIWRSMDDTTHKGFRLSLEKAIEQKFLMTASQAG